MTIPNNLFALIITRRFCASLILVCCHFCVSAQHVQILNENKTVSLRGLSVVDDQVVWVSGSKGTVGKSQDGGKTWWWTTVAGFAGSDFRDIEAFDANTAVIMAISEPAHILRTEDGGQTWHNAYQNNTKGMFLDAMDFSDNQNGAVVGDPVEGKFFIAQTRDGGKTWKEDAFLPPADSADGCFASSGTNLRNPDAATIMFVSAGKTSKLFYKNKFITIPFDKGNGSTGANSLAIRKSGATERWIVVGGDFRQDTLRARNCFISTDQGKSWTAPVVSPGGYRSCVEFIDDSDVITCGLNGVDLSSDAGKTWKNISSTGFHACRKAKKGNTIYLSGNNGKIGKVIPK